MSERRREPAEKETGDAWRRRFERASRLGLSPVLAVEAVARSAAPRVQTKPLVNAPHMDSAGYWEPITDNKGRVTRIDADNLKLKPNRSLPGTGHNNPTKSPRGWSWLQSNALTHLLGPPNDVRMHMLNGQMGGPGNDEENLAPGSASLNSHHEKNFENEAKGWLTRGGEIEQYTVSAEYNPPSSRLQSTSARKRW